MDVKYIISQLFVVMGMFCLVMSYLAKDKKKIMIFCVFSSLFYGSQYLVLGAISGFTMNIVSIIRNIWFYLNAKANKKNDINVFIILCAFSIIIGVFSFDGIFSILPVIITIIFTYSVWQDNNKVYRLLALPMSIMWIIYSIYCQSLFGIIAESILFILEIIVVIKTFKKINKRVE